MLEGGAVGDDGIIILIFRDKKAFELHDIETGGGEVLHFFVEPGVGFGAAVELDEGDGVVAIDAWL